MHKKVTVGIRRRVTEDHHLYDCFSIFEKNQKEEGRTEITVALAKDHDGSEKVTRILKNFFINNMFKHKNRAFHPTPLIISLIDLSIKHIMNTKGEFEVFNDSADLPEEQRAPETDRRVMYFYVLARTRGIFSKRGRIADGFVIRTFPRDEEYGSSARGPGTDSNKGGTDEYVMFLRRPDAEDTEHTVSDLSILNVDTLFTLYPQTGGSESDARGHVYKDIFWHSFGEIDEPRVKSLGEIVSS